MRCDTKKIETVKTIKTEMKLHECTGHVQEFLGTSQFTFPPWCGLQDVHLCAHCLALVPTKSRWLQHPEHLSTNSGVARKYFRKVFQGASAITHTIKNIYIYLYI
ncbi:unnamed protein product [Ixodes pacificus]